MSGPVFNGTPEQQALAQEIFCLMRSQGRFFAPHAPIRQTLSGLVEFFASRSNRERTALAQEIDLALRVNDQVFRREEQEQEIIYTTARIGYYQPQEPDTLHTFKQRLHEPEEPLPLDDMSAVVSSTRPVTSVTEQSHVSSYWREQARLASPQGTKLRGPAKSTKVPPPISSSPAVGSAYAEQSRPPQVVKEDIRDMAVDLPPTSEGRYHTEEPESKLLDGVTRQPEEEATVLPVESAQAIGPDRTTFPSQTTDSATHAIEVRAEAGGEVEETTDAVAPAGPAVQDAVTSEGAVVQETSREPPRELTLILPGAVAITVSSSLDELIAQHGRMLESALIEAFDNDPLRRIVTFGRLCYPESNLTSLGKNDLRRIRDYIQEIGEPLTDTAIIADLYHHNLRGVDYEGFRFSLNYRLSRERDFEFVGVEGANLWSTKGLAAPGSKRIKASEMGHITAYLEQEGFDDSLTFQSAQAIEQSGSVTRLLTFFEWHYGVLPLDASLRILFPRPVLPDQRSAVLRVESPQHYTSFLVEVRYPTGNRGGWVQGFDDFFHEHLIAGALITIAKSDEPNVYTISYEETAPRTDRLLILDEKKNRHVFAELSYSCEVDEDLLVNQQNLSRAKNLKALPMSDRRKADLVLEHVFEAIGEQIGTREEPQYQIHLKDLHLAYNVLRPISLPYLLALLRDHARCSVDPSNPERYFYRPEPEQREESIEEIEEEEEQAVKLARKWGYGYDDE